jgi:predicted aminopeptidase
MSQDDCARTGCLREILLRVAQFAAFAFLVTALSGCEFGYLARAAYEEGRILWNRKPINEMLARNDLSPETRAKLETVLQVRAFARDALGEKVGGAYKTYSVIDQDAIVWVVMAAPPTRLVPVTWWFPIVGNVPYRGYFHREDALAEADRLKAAGMDTMVRPAVAFSSLGFFNDPLLSNLLELNRIELAGVITHELFHRTFFLPSDVMFDESAATWVGSHGAVEFFARTEGPDSPDASAARAIADSDLKFARFLLQADARLLRLYQSDLPKDEILTKRRAVFASIQADYARLAPTLSGLERFDLDKEPLNNAVLVNYLIYFHNLWDFDQLRQQNRGDLRTTIQKIIELAKSEPGDPFNAIWQATHRARYPEP